MSILWLLIIRSRDNDTGWQKVADDAEVCELDFMLAYKGLIRDGTGYIYSE